MLKQTPFHPRVAALCHSYDWRRWSGYLVASKYELTPEREYAAIRSAVALIDVSPLFKYRISGPDAGRFLDRVMTRRASGCPVGRVMYTLWCEEDGAVREDGTVHRLAEDVFRVTAAEPNLRWFEENAAGLDVTVDDETEAVAALALQGPLSRDLLAALGVECVAGLRYFGLARGEIAACPLTVTRTGFTGDLGYEIWMNAGDALAVWDALVERGRDYGLMPAGMLALDMARIEAGLLLIDVDYTPANKALIPEQKSNPYELGLGWTVDLNKPGYFVGRRAFATQQGGTPAWTVMGLEIDWDSLERAYARVNLPPRVPHVAWRESVPLYTPGGEEAGYATSGCFSTVLKRYLALATLRSPYAEPGAKLEMEVTVEHMRRRARARVVKLPFFDPPRKRS